MEQREILKLKLNEYIKAPHGFEEALNIELSGFNDIIADAVKNGRIQKFEYCSELTWKIIKRYLVTLHGIDSESPKASIKNFFTTGIIDETEYELLMDIIDDRNRLSHIYRIEIFNEISDKLNDYMQIMKRVSALISKDI